jgi:integrase
MASFRTRNGQCQAIVRIKRHGVLVFSEAETFSSEIAARDWAKRLEQRIRREGVQSRKVDVKTFGALLEDYRRVRNEHRPMGRAQEHDLGTLDKHFGSRSLASLKADAWAAFARQRRTEGAGPATVLHNLSTARSVLNAARPMFGLDVDGDEVGRAISALRLTGHVANSRSIERRVTDDELQRLTAEFRRTAAHPSMKIRMDHVLAMAVPFPRRLSELCSMRWDDYDGRIFVLRDTKHPRGPRTEKVPVPPKARAVLETLPRFDELVLPYKPDSVSTAFERACDRLGITALRFHDLRHEGISRLFEAGLSIPEVSAVSGHQSWANLKRYTHLLEHTMEKMDGR